MRLEELRLDNFLTYNKFVYKFEDRPLQVQGLNLTDDKQKSNGSGKSGLMTGIEFCITASNSRDVRDAELVTYGEKSGSCELIAYCKVRKERIHITWNIFVKGSNKLTLLVQRDDGDWSEVSFSNVNDGKKWISSWFAITKEDMFNYFIINKTRFTSFFKSSNREKIELINRFSDASIIEGLEDIDLNDLEDELHKVRESKGNKESIISAYEMKIEEWHDTDFESELEVEKEKLGDEIDDVNLEIDDIRDEMLVEESKIKSFESDIEDPIEFAKDVDLLRLEVQKKIDVINTTLLDVNKTLTKRKKLVDSFKATDWRIQKNELKQTRMMWRDQQDEQSEFIDEAMERDEKIAKMLGSITLKLAGSIECPSCNHKWLPTNDTDESIKDLEKKQLGVQKIKKKNDKKKEHYNTVYKNMAGMITEIGEKLDKLEVKEEKENDERQDLRDAHNEVTTQFNNLKRQVDDLKSDMIAVDKEEAEFDNRQKEIGLKIKEVNITIKGKESQIKGLTKDIKRIKKEIKNLKVGNAEQQIKDIRSDIKLLEKEVKVLVNEESEVGDRIYVKNQWINNFKQFRMFLANQSLEAIQYHMNRYLIDMGSDIRIELEGFRVLASGKIKEEITAKVIRDIERSFSSFSGGEQGRMLFASILANRHMINSTHPYGGLDFLCIDEVFEGVDSLGLKHLIDSAQSLGISVMIITHVTDEDPSNDVLTIVKENGISNIKLD